MSDKEIYELINNCENWAGRPFTYPSELAERLGVTRQAVYWRAERLVEEGRINKHLPGNSVVYWTE